LLKNIEAFCLIFSDFVYIFDTLKLLGVRLHPSSYIISFKTIFLMWFAKGSAYRQEPCGLHSHNANVGCLSLLEKHIC